MTNLSLLMTRPDPVDVLTARSVHGAGRVPEPERRIREAILMDAIGILRAGVERAKRPTLDDLETKWRHDYAEARRWIASTDRGHPFAFELVCDVLGLAADRVRAHVLASAPEIPTPAHYLELVTMRSVQAHERMAARAWAWAERQVSAWCVGDLSAAINAPINNVRGLVSLWLKTGRAEQLRAPVGRQGGLYRLTSGAARRVEREKQAGRRRLRVG